MTFPFYIKLSGSRQGDFKDDSSNPGRVGWIKGLDFQLHLDSPRDQATGQASGKRIWKPIVIIKEWDAASPQLLQALATNELLSVLIEFESKLPDGSEGTYYSVHLTDAAVTELRQYIGRHGEAVDLVELE
jgi:type VI secretion system secreted protein Hcp